MALRPLIYPGKAFGKALPSIALFSWVTGLTAAGYVDNAALGRQLKELSTKQPQILRVEKAAVSPLKNEVWRVELGNGSDDYRRQRPALLAVAGIEGNDLAGTASLMTWVEDLAGAYSRDAKVQQLLDTTTIYLWPRLNPDAIHHFFAKPRLEKSTSDQPADDDHDGLLDEDGPDDLDGDGLLAWMRVEDPEGEFILDPTEPRLLLKAEKVKGERGAWRLLTEGRDNDGDKQWNEDGLGGVNFNRNFPYQFRFFAAGSGRHAVSEIETRALADFVVGHPNIGLVFTFGAAENLTQTPKGEAPKRPPVALHEEDLGWYREVGKTWREGLGLKKELPANSEPGSFSDWMYFHRGRFSLATRAWSSALQLELAKAEKPKEEPSAVEKGEKAKSEKAEPKAGDKSKDPENRNEEDRAFLKWVLTNAPESFIEWKAFVHPDFPGKKVEVGGFAPFARSNPPESLWTDWSAKHSRLLTELAGKLPRLAVRKFSAKALGEAVYDVTVQVENTGYLPTALAQGELTKEVLPTRVVLKTDNKNVLSGSRITMLPPIQGGESKEVRWVVRAKGEKRLELEVISALAGRLQTSVELTEANK